MLNAFFYYSLKKTTKSSAITINLTELWLFPKWGWHLECVLDTNHHLLSGSWEKGWGEGEVHFKDTYKDMDIKDTPVHFLENRHQYLIIFSLWLFTSSIWIVHRFLACSISCIYPHKNTIMQYPGTIWTPKCSVSTESTVSSYCSVAKWCWTLQPHGLQHTWFPCPSLTLRVCSNLCLPSWWCYLTISSKAILFSCLWSFPASGSFPVSQLFTSGSQSTRASSLAWVLSINIQDWLPLGLTNLISLLSKGLSIVYSSTTIWRHQFSGTKVLWSNSHIYTTTRKIIALTIQTFVSQVISPLFNTLPRFVRA